jgi:hypothetical protein
MSAAKTIAKLLIAIGVSVDGAKKAQDAVDDTTKSAENTDKKGSPKLKAFAKTAVAAFLGIKVGAAAAAGAILAAGKVAFNFANEQTAAMDEIAKGSKKLALGTDEYQRLSQAAGHLGTSTEDLGAGIRKLNAEMLAVSQGTGQAFENKLAQIGLSAKQLEGKSTTDQLGMIGDALKLIEDDAERAAHSAKIFGEDAGPKLANVLAAGTEGLHQLSDAAEGVFTEEQIGRAEQVQTTLKDFKHMISGVAGDLAVAMAPAITAVVDAIRTFIAENEDLIKQQLPKILTMILDNALKLLPVVLDVAAAVADLVIKAAPLIDQFVVFTSGALEGSMRATLSILEAILPVILAITGTIMEAVGGAETLVGLQGQVAKRGAPKFLADEKKEDVAAKAGKAASEQWARDRHLSEAEIKSEINRKIDAGEVSSFEQGVAALKEEFDPVLSFAQMGQQAKAREAQRKAREEEERKRRAKGGGGKKKDEKEKVSAHFGDYRDVLMTYQGKGPEESLKALEALEKGVMPKDHKPETSIQITNNITNHIDVGGIDVNGAGSPVDVAKAVASELARTFKRVAANTPNTISR